MKGLLLKDIYMAARYCRVYPVILLVFAAVSVMGQGNFLFLAYPMMLAGVVPVNLLAYDEKSRWDTYCHVFPYTRRQLVSVKYLIAFFALIITLLISAAAQVLKLAVVGGDWNLLLPTLGILAVAGLIQPSLLLPAMFRYGTEKGRIYFYALIVVFFGGFGAVGALGDASGLLTGNVISGFVPVFLVAALLLFFLSWELSVRFYRKREF